MIGDKMERWRDLCMVAHGLHCAIDPVTIDQSVALWIVVICTLIIMNADDGLWMLVDSPTI